MTQRYQHHIFVCTHERGPNDVSCGAQNSKELLALLKAKSKEESLDKKVRINGSGCLGFCLKGPVVVNYPEGQWLEEATVETCLKLWQDIKKDK